MDPPDPIQPDEVILRRIPQDQMGDDAIRRPVAHAFRPNKLDDDGLSFYREKYHTPEQVSQFRPPGGKPTWVARMTAKSITDRGLTLQPNPRPEEDGLPERPGHVVIPEMNSENRRSDEVKQWGLGLVECVFDVHGGDAGFPAPPAPAEPAVAAAPGAAPIAQVESSAAASPPAPAAPPAASPQDS